MPDSTTREPPADPSRPAEEGLDVVGGAGRFIRRWFYEIGLIAGLVLCAPDFAREVGVFGPAMAVSFAILLAGRTIASAIREHSD